MTHAYIDDPTTGMKRTCLLFTNSQWKEMKDLISKKQTEKRLVLEKIKDMERRKDVSQSMAKTWPNTPLNVMKKGEELRKQALELEEKERDRFFKELIEEKTRLSENMVKRAEEVRFLDTDDPKNFISALRYSEALRQQEIQRKFDKVLKDKVAKMDQNYAESIKADVEKYKKEQEEEQKKKHEAVMKFKEEVQKMYLEDQERRRQEKEKQREEEVKDLANIKREIQEIEENEKIEIERKRAIVKGNVEENKNMMEEKKKLREEEEAEENRAIQIVSEAKKKLALIRRQKELEIKAAKFARRDKIADVAMKAMTSKDKDEEDRIKKAQDEKEEIYQLEQRNKKEHSDKLLEERKNAHEEYLKREEKRKSEEREKKKWALMERLKMEENYDKFKQDKFKKGQDKTRELRETWLKQIEEKNAENDLEKEMDVCALKQDLKRREELDKRFLVYTDKIMNESKEKGRPLLPLEKCLYDFKVRNNMIEKKPRPSIWESNFEVGQDVKPEIQQKPEEAECQEPPALPPSCPIQWADEDKKIAANGLQN